MILSSPFHLTWISLEFFQIEDHSLLLSSFPFSVKNTVNHGNFVYTLNCSSSVSFDIPLFSATCLTPVIAGLWLELNTDE